MRPLIQGVGGFSPEIRRRARTSAADSTQALDFCRHKEEIEILERKFTSSLIVCKRQATVAGEGDRKSNEALDWLPGQWLPHTRLIEWHRMLPSRVRSWSSWHQRWTHFWSNFNLKISLHWSDLHLRSLHPTTIYSHRFSHPYYTHCDLGKPVGRHFSNSLKLGPPTFAVGHNQRNSSKISSKTLIPPSILLGRATFYVFWNKALVTRIMFVCSCNLFW